MSDERGIIAPTIKNSIGYQPDKDTGSVKLVRVPIGDKRRYVAVCDNTVRNNTTKPTEYGLAPVTAALMAAFLLAGCTQVQPYIDKAEQAVKPLTDAAKTVLENVDIKPTPEQRPEDDTN